MTASETAFKIRSGQITSEAVVRELIARAEAKSGLNTIITLDAEGALAEARAADRAVKSGKEVGPLAGVPLVVKDNIHVKGLPNTAGTPALRDFVPTKNAPVIESLVRAGAIILAKTNMHELAFGITSDNATFGAVANARDPGKFAGGSSGGTASAVASGIAPAGLGTDTGGSVRIPAALNGIAGLRPTLGRYPQAAITPISTTRDTAGPMARSVADLVLLDGVITGQATSLAKADLAGVRLGVPRGYFYKGLDTETAAITDAALGKLKSAGVAFVEADIPGLADLNNGTSFPVALFEAKRDLAAYLDAYVPGMTVEKVAAKIASPDVKGIFGMILGDKAIPEPVYRAAIKDFRPKLRQAYSEYFARHKVDGIIFPTTPLPARDIVGTGETVKLNGRDVPTFPTFIQNTDPGSNAGVPGLTLPIGRTAAGLPVGIEIDGPAWSDRRLLAVALAMEDLFAPLGVAR